MEHLIQNEYHTIEIEDADTTIQISQKNRKELKEVIVIDKKHFISFIGLLIKEYSTLNQQK